MMNITPLLRSDLLQTTVYRNETVKCRTPDGTLVIDCQAFLFYFFMNMDNPKYTREKLIEDAYKSPRNTEVRLRQV